MWKLNRHIKKNVPEYCPERLYKRLIVPVKGDAVVMEDVAARADALAKVVAVPALAGAGGCAGPAEQDAGGDTGNLSGDISYEP